MKRRSAALLRAVAVCLAAGCAGAASAEILYTGMAVREGYRQTAAGTEFAFGSINFTVAARNQNDFDTILMRKPGETSSTAYAYQPVLSSNGAYSAVFARSNFFGADLASTEAMMNAAYPFGTYLLTGFNSATSNAQSASIQFDALAMPHVPGQADQRSIPALTAATYASLQGVNPDTQHALSFNTFQGDGVPLTPGEVTPYTSLVITKEGQVVYRSEALPAGTSTLLLPAHTLEAGTTYTYFLEQLNLRHCGPGLACGATAENGYFQNFSTSTTGFFTTADVSPVEPVALTVQGGTLANPAPLVYQGQIGQVNGTIGGIGSEAFYLFYWSSGEFRANVGMTGADGRAEYKFMLLDMLGNVLEDLLLDVANGFTADMMHTMGAGTYRVGLVSITPYDPEFTITFDRPVQGVPEPATLALMAICLAGLAAASRKRAVRVRAPAGR